MQVKIAMMSAGKNREREVLRCMQTGVESKLLPDDRDLWKGQKQACASKGEGFGVVCNYDERVKQQMLAFLLVVGKQEITFIIIVEIVMYKIVRYMFASKLRC